MHYMEVFIKIYINVEKMITGLGFYGEVLWRYSICRKHLLVNFFSKVNFFCSYWVLKI